MGGGWKQGEALKKNLRGWVEFEIYGSMSKKDTRSFDKDLADLLQKYGSKPGKVLRRLKLKVER